MTKLPPDERLERCLRQHIEEQERQIDVSRVLARIRVDSNSGSKPARGPWSAGRRWQKLLVGLSAAAMLTIAVVIGTLIHPAHASAEAMLREAQRSLLLPIDRCYLVEVRRESGATEEPLPARSLRIWTTGDRFRVESIGNAHRYCWGRDDTGSVWLAANSQRGLRVAADEAGPAMQWACDLYGLQPDTVLNEILGHCSLKELEADRTGLVRTIRATPCYAGRPLRSAEVELDSETKAIRRLALTRQTSQGIVTTSFTLVETRPVEFSRYQLEGNLAEPYEVYDRDHEPQRRRELLKRWVGSNVDRWLRPAN